jgi:pimeloyl-ACP methyl ester carboxylesterase
METAAMETIASRDGTRIAFGQSGAGPHLVLVHGTAASQTRWAPVLSQLGEHFTVTRVDRRGRGGSGDGGEYTIEREFDDVAAIVDSLGGPVLLFGHSYGAICALEAATRTGNVAGLVLYEPPIVGEGERVYSEELLARLEALLATNDRKGVLLTFFGEVVRMPPHELEKLQAAPSWPARVAAAHTLPRELRGQQDYQTRPEALQRLEIPVLLLLGGDSPPFFKAAVDRLAALLPNARLVVMPGQQHIAMDTAPDLVIGAVVDFWRGRN